MPPISKFVVVKFSEIFGEFFIRKHFFELAPSGLSALAGRRARAPVDPIEKSIVVLIFFVAGRLAEHLLVEIEAFRISFGHLKPLKINGLC